MHSRFCFVYIDLVDAAHARVHNDIILYTRVKMYVSSSQTGIYLKWLGISLSALLLLSEVDAISQM